MRFCLFSPQSVMDVSGTIKAVTWFSFYTDVPYIRVLVVLHHRCISKLTSSILVVVLGMLLDFIF